MSRSRKLLLLSGMLLVLWGMSYGLWFALFDEHPTLEGMGVALATGFAQAAQGEMAATQAEIGRYADIRYEYVREVHIHSHWAGLAMLLLIYGILFDRVGFGEGTRWKLAVMFAAGALLYPLGVSLQIFSRGLVAEVVAGAGAVLLTVALLGVAVGLGRGGSADEQA
jgi:hypothetical protein